MTSARGSAGWNHLPLNQQFITLLPIPHALQCDTSSSRSVYSSLGEISNTQPRLGKRRTCPVVLDERLLPSHSRGSGGLRNRHYSPFLPSSLSAFRQGKGQHTRCLLLSSHPALSGHGTVRGRARVAQHGSGSSASQPSPPSSISPVQPQGLTLEGTNPHLCFPTEGPRVLPHAKP